MFVVILIICIGDKLYDMWEFSIDKDQFIKLTGISKFEVISNIREHEYTYMITKVSAKDKQKILSNHYYLPLPVDIRGNLTCYFKPDPEKNYVYYLDNVGHGYLGYVIYFVSKVDNTVMLYRSYAD